ncbi:MAG: amino acid ABC transporter permease [Verrucomicrobiales bacterium]|nr:amino acid ABC transporter permease [Verrucomicrobiales bacterium]
MKKALSYFLFSILAAGFCFFFYILLSYDFSWHKIAPYRWNLIRGWGMTLILSACALILSSLFGSLLLAGQLAKFRPTRILSRLYVEIIRGTPLLVQILIIFYLIADAAGLHNKFIIGTLILSVFSGAYLSEIFRGGIESIPRSQIQSARAIGLTESQIYRYVIIPQAIRRVLPGVSGQFANLIKDSSLLYVIGLREFTMQAREVNAATYSTFAAYIPLAIGYLLLTLPLAVLSHHLEKRFRYEH